MSVLPEPAIRPFHFSYCSVNVLIRSSRFWFDFTSSSGGPNLLDGNNPGLIDVEEGAWFEGTATASNPVMLLAAALGRGWRESELCVFTFRTREVVPGEASIDKSWSTEPRTPGPPSCGERIDLATAGTT